MPSKPISETPKIPQHMIDVGINASVGVQGSQAVILIECGTPAAAERLKAALLAGKVGRISLGGRDA